jgi:hypothetical protein
MNSHSMFTIKNLAVIVLLMPTPVTFLKVMGENIERLLGQWGVVDVNDCCSCATFLVCLVQ